MASLVEVKKVHIQIRCEYQDTPQIFISELNRFVREHQPPRGFCAKVVWEHKATREEVEREEEEESMINRNNNGLLRYDLATTFNSDGT